MTPELQDKILACQDPQDFIALLPDIEFATTCGTLTWRITPDGDAVTLVDFEHPSSKVRLHYFPQALTLAVDAVWECDFCGEICIAGDDHKLFDLILDSVMRRVLPVTPNMEKVEIVRAINVRSAILFACRGRFSPVIGVGQILHSLDDEPTIISELDVSIHHLLEAYWRSGASDAVVAAMKSRGPRWIMELVTKLLITAGKNFNTFIDYEIMPEDNLGGREFVELLVLLHREEYPEEMVPLPIVQIAAAFICRLWGTFDAVQGRNSWLSFLTVLDAEPLEDVLRRLSP